MKRGGEGGRRQSMDCLVCPARTPAALVQVCMSPKCVEIIQRESERERKEEIKQIIQY